MVATISTYPHEVMRTRLREQVRGDAEIDTTRSRDLAYAGAVGLFLTGGVTGRRRGRSLLRPDVRLCTKRRCRECASRYIHSVGPMESGCFVHVGHLEGKIRGPDMAGARKGLDSWSFWRWKRSAALSPQGRVINAERKQRTSAKDYPAPHRRMLFDAVLQRRVHAVHLRTFISCPHGFVFSVYSHAPCTLSR